MQKNNPSIFEKNFKKNSIVNSNSIIIEPFKRTDMPLVQEIIQQNIKPFLGSSSMLAATFRRLKTLGKSYQEEGCQLLVARRQLSYESDIAGCIGLGPLHGLSPTEGFGEIHDFIVKPEFRKQGIGSKLLNDCLEQAANFKYRRLYLETTQDMAPACTLFLRSGFRPVTSKSLKKKKQIKPKLDNPLQTKDNLPCYFLLENLQT